MLTDGLDWTGVDYCDVFISCLDSHSDGTHSLQRIRWWASDAVRHFSKSAWMKKQTYLMCILDGMNFMHIFIFLVNYAIKESA